MAIKKNPFRTIVVKESLWTLITTVLSRIGGLVFTVLLARFLMPEGFGLYGLALSIAIVFITFADLGISQALLRYVASTIDKNPKKASSYFHYLLRLKIKAALLASFTLLALAYVLSNTLFKKPELFPLLLVLSIYTFIAAIQGFFESLFYTKNKVNRLALKEAVFQLLRIIFLVVMIAVIAKEYYALGAAIGLIISSILTLLLLFILYKKVFNFTKDNVPIDKSRVNKFILFLTLSSLAGVLFSYIDTIVMGIFLSFEYIGYYRAAMSLVITVAGALSFPGVFLAALTRVRQENIQDSFDKIIRVLLLILIPAIVGLMVLSRYFIVFLYGHEYLPGTALLYILSPFIFLFVTTSIFLNVMTSKERTRELSLLTVLCTALNIGLIVLIIKILVPYSQYYATLGAAVATLLSWTIYFIGGVITLRKKMNLIFKFRFMTKPLIASFVMAAVIYGMQNVCSDMTFLSGLGEVIFGVVVYFGILFLLGEITKGDIQFMKSFFAKNS